VGDHEAWNVKVCGSICIHVFIKMWVVALWMINLTRRGWSCTKWNIWRGDLLILLLLAPSKKYCKGILKLQVPPLWNCFELGEATKYKKLATWTRRTCCKDDGLQGTSLDQPWCLLCSATYWVAHYYILDLLLTFLLLTTVHWGSSCLSSNAMHNWSCIIEQHEDS